LKQRNIRTTTSVSNPNNCAQNRTTQSSKKEKNNKNLSNAAASTNLSKHQNPQQISPIPWRKTTVGLWVSYVFIYLFIVFGAHCHRPRCIAFDLHMAHTVYFSRSNPD
jgi:hypothetical protein